MISRNFFNLGSEPPSVAQLRAALAAAERNCASAASRVAEAEAARGWHVLNSGEHDIQSSEAKLAEARLESERSRVVKPLLAERLAAAERRERLAAAQAATQAAMAAREAFLAWWETRYMALAGELVAGLALEREYFRAIDAAIRSRAPLGADAAGLPRLPDPPARELNPGGGISGAGDWVRLPPANLAGPSLWPPAEARV
jgi:hypothetical protein